MDKPEEKSASINELEKVVFQRNYKEAEEQLILLIKLYSKDKILLSTGPFDRKLSQQQSDLESYQVLEKLAVILTVWFSDPNWQPDTRIYSYLSMQKHFFNVVFLSSSYHSTDHIVRNLGLLNKSGYTPDEIRKVLLLITMESDIQLPWKALVEHVPDTTAQAFIGLISSLGLQLSKRAQKNISAVLQMSEFLPTIDTSEVKNYGPLLRAFFNCSNLADPNKYKLKKWITRSIDGFIENKISNKLKKRLKQDVKKKPFLKDQTVLFVHEHYKTKHAMYRSWHALVSQVKTKYNTVALGLEKNVDDRALKDFDKAILVEDEWDIEGIANKILNVKPDVIVYSSIGMSAYTPFLASMRLAPIQIVLPGHPASSHIANVDYLFMPKESLTEEQLTNIITEKWLECPDGPGQVTLLNKESTFVKRDTNQFNIVVNGVIQKVSQDLIESCQRITQQANRPINFVFFMAHPKQDIDYFAAKSMLRRFLPNSIIHPFGKYPEYMTRLSECKFSIPTFPFGGSNSNIDLIRLGLPKLFMVDTNDLPGISDMQIWQELGETYGYCESVEELERRAVELINNPAELASFTSKIEQIDLYEKGLSSDFEKEDTRLLDAISRTLS